MSGAIAQMAAAHPSNEYEVPGDGPALLQPAGSSTESVPLPVGGRRRHRKTRHTKRRKTHKTRKHYRRR